MTLGGDMSKYTLLILLALAFMLPNTSWGYDFKDEGASTNDEASYDFGTHIQVNVPSRRLKVFQNGEVVHEFPVAVGQPRFKTPIGPRKMTNIVWNPWWIPPKTSAWAKNDKDTPPGPHNPLGPVKMKLGSAILLHGTSNESTVGRAASHGCMRMFNKDAKTLAWWVQSRFSDSKDNDLYTEYQSNNRRSYHVNLAYEIPVDITYNLFEIENGVLKAYPDIYWKKPNRKQEAINFLVSRGFEPHQINEKKLSQFLKDSQKQGMQIELKKIYKGKVASVYSANY